MNVDIPALTNLLSRGYYRGCEIALYLTDEMFWSAYVRQSDGDGSPVILGDVPLIENGRTPAEALEALECTISGMIEY
jgi:hypothetical protein